MEKNFICVKFNHMLNVSTISDFYSPDTNWVYSVDLDVLLIFPEQSKGSIGFNKFMCVT